MSGSMGYGNMVQSMLRLDNMEDDFQLLCICGRNEKTFEKLSSMTFKKDVRIFGFVDDGDVMMDAADCLITKPGGLSTTESMTKGLPMILVNPIPGQEERNSEFFVNSGAAIRVTKHYPVDEAVYMLYHFPERLDSIKRAMADILPKNATAAITDLILGLEKQ